ncbi:hypothetical protein [Flavihumibacter sp. UBA7668]|uniref:hypothetical protein n=1 Tax=Flavihumibacter sp. UBA7668 TaxID=1946542 RepID=UPI0025BE5674|nr:hypothetical protein [Flavihumibacter sp. UBA7668]
MTKLPALFLFLILCQLVFSQHIEKTEAQPFKLSVGTYGTTVIGADENFLYLQSLNTKLMLSQTQKVVDVPTLSRISKKTLEPQKEATYKELIKGRDWVGFLMIRNRIYFFSKEKNGKTGLDVFAAELDKESLQPVGETKKLGTFSLNQHYESAQVAIKVGVDSSRFLLIVDGDKENNVIQVVLTDLDLKTQPINSLTVRPTGKSFIHSGVWLLSNGFVLVRGSVFDEVQEGRKTKRKLKGFSSKLYSDKGILISEQMEEANLQVPMVTYIKENNEKQVEMIGFIGNNPEERKLTGIYYKLIDIFTGNPKAEIFQPFEGLHPVIAKKLNEDNSFRLKSISLAPDGKNRVLIAESYQEMNMTRRESNNRDYYRTDLFFRDLLIIQFNPLDKINWVSLVPRNQITMMNSSADWWNFSPWTPIDHFPGTSSGLYGSTATIPRKEALYLLFNDNPENSGVISPDAKVSRSGGATGVPNLIKIDYISGKLSRSVLTGIPKGMGILSPKVFGKGDNWYLLSREHTGFGLAKFEYHFSLLKF